MNLNHWFLKRGSSFILHRGSKLLNRYSFRNYKTISRISELIERLSDNHCSPTFFVPAIVVKRNPIFFRSLQAKGCEIGVHGYNHVDLTAYSPEESARQLLKAVQVFQNNQIEVHGFRCPYLSSSNRLINSLSQGSFKYSSNKAVRWIDKSYSGENFPQFFNTINRFYQPSNSEEYLCLPWKFNNLIEIPVFVPDDLQLHDGLGFNQEQIFDFWLNILRQTYQRGELFNLMFHPELASFIEVPLIDLLRELILYTPHVWITRLCDLSLWWSEFEKYEVEINHSDNGYDLIFRCSPRSTLLYRGFSTSVKSKPWDGIYRRSLTPIMDVQGQKLPFIGLPDDAPDWVYSNLRRVGYVLIPNNSEFECNLFLDDHCLRQFSQPIELIKYIETQNFPLVRFWPWPDGARSAICITGDLDALSLIDYAARIFN